MVPLVILQSVSAPDLHFSCLVPLITQGSVWHYLTKKQHYSKSLFSRRLHLFWNDLFFHSFNHFCCYFLILSSFKCSSQSRIAPFDNGLAKNNYYSSIISLPLFIYYYITALLHVFYSCILFLGFIQPLILERNFEIRGYVCFYNLTASRSHLYLRD